jgi:DNA-binding CsgD family transcriptional regulator/PAS domain-containing protein
MTTDLRRTGIDALGHVPWGSHVCVFYETKDDLLDTVIPYFEAGAKSKEFCLWAVSEPLTMRDAKNALRQAIPSFDRCLADGGFEIFSAREWYLKDKRFSPQRIIDGWRQKLHAALAKGYEGMRVSGNSFWLATKYWKDFLDYERDLNRTVITQRMTALCSYPLAASGPREILDVALAHQFAIIRRRGEWEIVETPELKQAKQTLKELNEELERRVVERTRQLNSVALHAFDHLDVGAVLTDRDGRPIGMNRSAERILRREDGLVIRNGRLSAQRGFERTKLARFIAAAAVEKPPAATIARMLVGSPRRQWPYIVTVAPLEAKLAAYDRPLAMVLIGNPEAHSLCANDIADLFGMSPAESRLAAALMVGKTLQDIAKEFAPKISTLRTQLSMVLKKVGVERQVDLVRMLSNLRTINIDEES